MSKGTLAALVEIISSKPVLVRKDLMRRYGRDEDTIDRWHRNGTLPAAKYLKGSNIPLWRPCDIEANEKTNPKMRKAISRKIGTGGRR